MGSWRTSRSRRSALPSRIPGKSCRRRSSLTSSLVSVAFHGVAYGMILYVISVGLSVTMGLMGFINLAHGVFAMAGGFILSTLIARFGGPFPPALLAAFFSLARLSIILEPPLDFPPSAA